NRKFMEKTSEWLLSFSTSFVDHNLLKEIKREGLSFNSSLSKKAKTISATHTAVTKALKRYKL
ncbi:MAG: hypothetical protein AAB453_04080, partial [Patescibacteria group bacterium]